MGSLKSLQLDRLKDKSIGEILRKIEKRIRLRLSDELIIKKVDEVAIVPVLRCNLDCVMCHQGEIKKNPNMTFEDFKIIIRRLKAEGVIKISLVGGEIFVHPRMKDFIQEMENMGFKYDLSSNLYIVPNIESFKDLKGLEMVTTSIDGFGELHNQIRRRADAFENTIRNIKKLIEMGIRVDVATVVQKANFDRLEELLEYLCEEIGVRKITYIMENFVSPEVKKETEELLSKIMGTEGSRVYVTSLKNPLGSLGKEDIDKIPEKVKKLREIAEKYGTVLYIPIQMEDPKLLDSQTSLKDYTCSLFNGYNGVVYHEGKFSSCNFIKFGGEHSLIEKGPIQIMNSPDYYKWRKWFKDNGAMEMCRRCCAIKHK